MKKLGRNQPCHCGSGKKYKHCHGRVVDAPARPAFINPVLKRIPLSQVPAPVMHTFQQRKREQAAFEAAHGKGRPLISMEFKDWRFVAVGNELHFSPAATTRFFPDFLGNYVRGLLGKEWGEAELKKLLQNRHQILQWYDAVCEFQQTLKPDSDGYYRRIEPSGALNCWLRLAYDLYLIKHNAKLQKRILDRLKDPKQFQGARFELCVTAAMVVAGFEINYEDEQDRSRKHPEFLARRGELLVAVEAKSRHRDGVLGFHSPKSPVTDKVAAEGILRDALGKNPGHPYFIFLEVNMPPDKKPIDEQNPWFKELDDSAKNLQNEWEPDDPFSANAIFFCNDPSHYVPEAVVPGQSFWTYEVVVRRKTMYPIAEDVGMSVARALLHRANIPNQFPPE